jgi:hypothetical protein
MTQTELEIARGAWESYLRTGDRAYIDNLKPDELRALAFWLAKAATA